MPEEIQLTEPLPSEWKEQAKVEKINMRIDDGKPEKVEVPEEEARYSIDSSEVKELKLPPKPVQLYEWNERDDRYNGPKDDIGLRVKYKLFKFHILWARLRTCVELEEILSRPVDESSDQYKVNSIVVHLMDAIAKILIDTELIEEYVWLSKKQIEREEKENEDILHGNTEAKQLKPKKKNKKC